MDWRKAETECKLEKQGTDNWIGDYFSALCGWSTYNKLDISHYEWHRRMASTDDWQATSKSF